MSLTPQDIEQHEFSKSLRGYDPSEVRAFMERLADEIAALQSTAQSLSEQNRALAAKLVAYQEMEQNLRDSLVAMQESQRITHEQLEQERQQILREARLDGERTKFDLERDISKLREDVHQLTIHRDAYVRRLRFLLRAQTELLEILENESPDLPHERPPSTTE
jgi:cell division initiation protein